MEHLRRTDLNTDASDCPNPLWVFFLIKRLMPFSLIIFMSLSVNLVMFHLFLELFTGFSANSLFLMKVVLMVKHLLIYRSLLHAKNNSLILV